ncbi:hypothetical protein ACLHDG_06420 [Sulfurovum sp. CS9]|uniref:hypothetical protein n=1 Tax=Sulfurovum sp. CS9 TaxID=3391146 RepID=UPI0039EB8509
MIIFRTITLLSLLLSLSNADINSTTQNEPHYIDETHTTLSKEVLEWSNTIDTTLSGWLEDNETNTTTIEPDISTHTIENNQTRSIDSFFQSNKYFNETNDAFIRVRIDSEFQSKESSDFHLRLETQLPLRKSKKSFKIFVDDLTLDNVQNIIKNEEKDHAAPDIGVHYFAPETYGIDSRYSVGFGRSYFFVSARYFMSLNAGEWKIDPTQLFKYSTKDAFEEETNIYFDKQLTDLSLFRIQFHRKTEDKTDGMDYAFSLQYYWSPKKDTGIRLSQSFFGNTEYPYVVDKNTEPPQIKTYGGINNYATSLSWRQNIWRKWFYYEVRPGVNFHKYHDYEANYTFRFFLDFYFGEFR